MAMMHTVEHNTHALPGSNQGRDANEEANERHDAPSTTSAAEGENNGGNETTDDSANAKTACKDDTGTVAIADGPSDEVGVGLATKRPLDRCDDVVESGRMC